MPLRFNLLCLLLFTGVLAMSVSQATAHAPDDSTATATPTTPSVGVQAGENGFVIRTDDGQFQLRVGGDIQINSQFFDARSEVGAPPAESFYVRRMRALVVGTVAERFDFRLMPNWGFGQASLQDAFLNARFAESFKVRAGKFKPPVGLEFLQSPNNLFLYERAYPTGLVPGRDVGVMIYGSVFDQRLDYAAGIFNGPVDGQSLNVDTNDAKDVMARLFARPFRTADSVIDGIGIGIAATIGDETVGGAGQSNLPNYRTPGRQTFFSYRPNAQADGQRTRIAPQGYWYAGPFGVMGEYVLSQQEVRAGESTADLTNQSWQVSISQVLTGEDASYGRVRPDNPYNGDGQWGAFELAARLHGIQVDSDAFPTFANPETTAESALTWGLGLSWYATANVRFSANYERTTFDSATDDASFDDEGMFIGRFQIAF